MNVPRPKVTDPRVVSGTAVELAPAVKKWLTDSDSSDDTDIDSIKTDLEAALQFNDDGYDVARALDQTGWYSPDAALVEILDGCAAVKRKILEALEAGWVIATAAQAVPVGTKVRWSQRAGVGIVAKNCPTGKAVVTFAGQSPGCGSVVAWEELEPA